MQQKLSVIEEWRRGDATGRRKLWAEKDALRSRLEQTEAVSKRLVYDLEEQEKQMQMVPAVPQALPLTEEGWRKGLALHKNRVRKMRGKLARAFAEVEVMSAEFRGADEQQQQERKGQRQWAGEQQARVAALKREMRLADEQREQQEQRSAGIAEAVMCREQGLQLQRWAAEEVAREAGADDRLMQRQHEIAEQMGLLSQGTAERSARDVTRQR